MNLRAAFFALAVLAGAGAAPSEEITAESQGVIVASPARTIADFTLTDQDGRAFAFSTLRGSPVLVFFGFTHCPDICPTTLISLRQVKENAPRELTDLKVVLISVDGDRDSPAAMKQYVRAFHPEFLGLTGSPVSVREIAAQFPAVFVKGIPAVAGGDYAVQHSPLVYAVDRSGRLRAQFSAAAVDTMTAYLRAMEKDEGATAAATSG